MKNLVVCLALAATSCATVEAAPHESPPIDRLLVPVAEGLGTADAVFFGESHDDRRHHELEAATLDAMRTGSDRPLVLGMEMFQRPFQAPLDDYVGGRIDEKEMLRRTEYFKRWSFDWTLYAPLWRWCRENGARIVALNAEADIARKVGREGLASLTPEERSRVAADIDLDDAAHHQRIMAIFEGGAHKMPPDRLRNLYEAQTMWDETMADSAASAFAAAGAGARILVVAGREHVHGLTGIPDRFARRVPGARRVVLVAEEDDQTSVPTVAHDGEEFVVTFPEREEPDPPKLGVQFDTDRAAEGLVVKSAVAGGAAAKAGVVAGDVLTSLDGTPLADMTDLRYALDPMAVGKRVKLEVRRGGATQTISLELAPPPATPPQP